MMEIKVWDFKFRVASRALHTQQRTDVTITPISCEWTDTTWERREDIIFCLAAKKNRGFDSNQRL